MEKRRVLGFSSFPSSGTHPRGESFSQPTGGCETGLRGCVHHVPWPWDGMGPGGGEVEMVDG